MSEFSGIPLALGGRVLPEDLAIASCPQMIPPLTDAEATVIIETVVAVLACRGSVSGAAEHRRASEHPNVENVP